MSNNKTKIAIDNVNFLKNIDIFSSLEIEEINNFISMFKIKEVEKDEILFKQGDQGNELFIVKYGKISSLIDTVDNKKHEVATFSDGDFFGEMSIFDQSPRSATCLAKEKSLLLSLHKNNFYNIIISFPATAIKIMHKMLNITKKRLVNTNVFISDIVKWGEGARKRSITDDLSGVYNRRFLDDTLPEVFENIKRKNESLSLIMIDLDELRDINKVHGQETGDKVIVEVVSVFKKYFRKDDIIARYGGDEFVIVLTNSTINKVKNRVMLISKEIENLKIKSISDNKIVKITISTGIGNYPKHANDLEILKEITDKALYKAKASGKNKIVCASIKK